MTFQVSNTEAFAFAPSACVICHRDTTGPGRIRVCEQCKAEARAELFDSGDTTNFECRVRDEAIPEGPKLC